jgi:hypothetical protein
LNRKRGKHGKVRSRTSPPFPSFLLPVRAASRSAVVLATLASGLLSAAPAPTPAGLEFFETKIRPVLAQDCYECHRTGGKRKAGLALDHRQALLTGGDSGPAIVPGDPAASLLLQAIRHDSEDLAMPKAGAKLEPGVIADFEQWIRLGAPDPRVTPPTDAQVAADTDWDAVLRRRKAWWSFQPLARPEISDRPAGPHPVDHLLAAKRRAAGLTLAAPADRATLIRRLSFALCGLPPTPEETAAFVADPRPDAYVALVDTLLASPRFGERWARHWMDWVRYADSHGSEGDAPIPNAWRYRDYLIRALNADVPYDQLVREHLAGDLLPNPRLNPALGLNESALGTAQLRMVLHGFAPTDALEELVRFTDDQINVVSKTFLGLTLSCARCHHHKFDPISQQDFTGWYGIFNSTAPAQIAVDAPDPAEPRRRAELAATKTALRRALAAAWTEDAAALPARLAAPTPDLGKRIAAAKDPSSLLHPWFNAGKSPAGSAPAAVLAAWRTRRTEAAAARGRAYPQHWDMTRPADFAAWRRDGAGAVAPAPAGEFAVAAEGERVVTGVYPAGTYSHLTSTKDRAVLLSPRFELEGKYDLWLRLTGEGGAYARFVVQNYPREGSVYPVLKLVGAQRQWQKLALDYWQGDRVHLEVTTAADQPVLADPKAIRSWFGLAEVRVTRSGDPAPLDEWEFAVPVLDAVDQHPVAELNGLAAAYGTAARTAVAAWAADRANDGQALFLDQLLRVGLLRNHADELATVQPLLAQYRVTEAALRIPTRAPGLLETGPVDAPLFARGNHQQPGAKVPRHFLDAFGSAPYRTADSGRLALAKDITRRDQPLAARVIVNRVWHHLFGRGLVATPDNFGRMGELPSQPELLDFLAGWFVDHGSSLKALIRLLVTSETWGAASTASPAAREKDPDNVLLSHAPVRRLEAEAIRDALLSVAGDLQLVPADGPPVTGREPRRSVFLRVKRNDLDPFLAAFDAPVPAGPVGRRDVTNVPAQSLTLLNDPFVRELAAHWAQRIESMPADDAARITAMYLRALGRAPAPDELPRARDFVARMAAERAAGETANAPSPWAELAHALFNTKEFIFLR